MGRDKVPPEGIKVVADITMIRFIVINGSGNAIHGEFRHSCYRFPASEIASSAIQNTKKKKKRIKIKESRRRNTRPSTFR